MAAGANRLANNVPVKRVKRAPTNLAAVLKVKVRIVGLDVGKPPEPLALLYTPEFAGFNLRLALFNVIGEGKGRRDNRIGLGHDGREQFVA